jgi:hypothetical protein
MKDIKEIWKFALKNKEYLVCSVVCLVLIIALSSYLAIGTNGVDTNETEQLQGLNEVIITSAEENIESTEVEDEDASVDDAGIATLSLEDEGIAVDGSIETSSIVYDSNPFEVFQSEIELLRSADSDTVKKYFGDSDTFTPEIISDRVTASAVSFVSSTANEDGTTELVVHICTLDYDAMNEAAASIKSKLSEENTSTNIDDDTKLEVAKGVVKGDYDLHYTIPVTVKDGQVVVTEQLKQAITGNWYHGVNVQLQSVECPLDK